MWKLVFNNDIQHFQAIRYVSKLHGINNQLHLELNKRQLDSLTTMLASEHTVYANDGFAIYPVKLIEATNSKRIYQVMKDTE